MQVDVTLQILQQKQQGFARFFKCIYPTTYPRYIQTHESKEKQLYLPLDCPLYLGIIFVGRKRVQNEIPLAVTLGSKSLAFIRRGRSQMHTNAGKKKKRTYRNDAVGIECFFVSSLIRQIGSEEKYLK